jgi:RimJ/RimL family protein N-acetyltransferase
MNRYWPLFGLRLATPELELQPLCEADLGPLSDLLPPDVELDPQATTYDIADPATSRGVILHQGYWRAYGTWQVSAWRLSFGVRRSGTLIGVQELEGNDFPRLGTVDTSSFLVSEARGLGHGKEMREAVLALAFGPMAARQAITSAWHDNTASLGVSRALGYEPNGEHLHARGDAVDVMVHLRLRREDWLARSGGEDVTVSGFEPCRHLFGLPRG